MLGQNQPMSNRAFFGKLPRNNKSEIRCVIYLGNKMPIRVNFGYGKKQNEATILSKDVLKRT